MASASTLMTAPRMPLARMWAMARCDSCHCARTPSARWVCNSRFVAGRARPAGMRAMLTTMSRPPCVRSAASAKRSTPSLLLKSPGQDAQAVGDRAQILGPGRPRRRLETHLQDQAALVLGEGTRQHGAFRLECSGDEHALAGEIRIEQIGQHGRVTVLDKRHQVSPWYAIVCLFHKQIGSFRMARTVPVLPVSGAPSAAEPD